VQPSLSFIKLGQPGKPPASGTVEVHWDTLQDGTYKRAGDFTSDFSPKDAANGTWQLWANGENESPTLGFIKLRNVGNPGKMVEVHLATLQDGVYKRAGDYVSDFSVNDADNGVWQLFGTGDQPLLGFIKLQHVGNPAGMVEVHVDALQGGSYVRIIDFVSDFSTEDAPNGVWQLPYWSLNPPTWGISFIKLQHVGNPAGMVEVHAGTFVDNPDGEWDGQNGYERKFDATSDFSPNDAANGTWQVFLNSQNSTFLGFIKLQHVGNPAGMVEFHFDTTQDSPPYNYKRVGDYTSDFSQADANNGVWGVF